jgi:hypothetical protein
MFPIGQVDLGGRPIDNGLDKLTPGIGVGHLKQQVGPFGGIFQYVHQLWVIGAEAAEVEGKEIENPIGVGKRPRRLLGDDVREIAGVALRTDQRFLAIVIGQLKDRQPAGGRQHQRDDRNDRLQPSHSPAAWHVHARSCIALNRSDTGMLCQSDPARTN